jgi:heterodisulfide reductase subunit B
MRLLPSAVRRHGYKAPAKMREPAPNSVSFFPGCSLHSTAGDFGTSIKAVAQRLDLQLEETPDWLCCGSKPAACHSRELSAEYPMRNLARVAETGHRTMTTPCASCFHRFKHAIHEAGRSPALAVRMEVTTGYAYDGIAVEHLVGTIDRIIGPKGVAARTKRPLSGLKIATYYGCLMTRPPDLTGADNAENPMQMDRLFSAAGADVVDWGYKTECCGASHGVTRSDIVEGLTRRLVDAARGAGADAIVTSCPLCHLNLDARQAQYIQREKKAGAEGAGLPVLYFTQALGLALGISAKDLAFGRSLVDARPVLAAKGLL